MDALIVDFDGVVIDSEPIHLACLQRVLGPLGIALDRDDYYEKYLGFDDHDCFEAISRDMGRPLSAAQIGELTALKTVCVKKAFAESVKALPGSVELLKAARAAGVATAVCSGGLRLEIELASRTVGASDHVMTIVAAEDVKRGKPDPEGYRLALTRLIGLSGRTLRADRTLVVEDAPAGIAAAKAAGMKVLAVMNSYPAQALRQADMTVHSLADVTLADARRDIIGT